MSQFSTKYSKYTLIPTNFEQCCSLKWCTAEINISCYFVLKETTVLDLWQNQLSSHEFWMKIQRKKTIQAWFRADNILGTPVSTRQNNSVTPHTTISKIIIKLNQHPYSINHFIWTESELHSLHEFKTLVFARISFSDMCSIKWKLRVFFQYKHWI